MKEVVFIVILLTPVLFVGIGYFLDYKKDNKYFLSGLKSALKAIVAFAFVVAIINAHKFIFPINTDYGTEYNSERQNLQIPLIEKGWGEVYSMSGQYRTWYMSAKSYDAINHTRKMIEFGYFGALKEHDFFEDSITNELYFVTHDYELNQKKYFKFDGGRKAPIFIDQGKSVSKEDFENKVMNMNK